MRTTSNRALGRHIGVSETAVRRAERAGRVTRETDGAWELARVRAAWAGHTDRAQQRQRQHAAAVQPVPEAAVGAVRETPGVVPPPRRPDHPPRGRAGLRAPTRRRLPPPSPARGQFEYAGSVCEEDRGRVGAVDFTDAAKAYFFPMGVLGLFRQHNAPADVVATATTLGLPRDAKQAVDARFARWVLRHVPSNPLPLGTRPPVLLRGRRT